MIAYIFSAQELKLLCGTMGIQALAKHQFYDNSLSNDECTKAIQTLTEKGFVSVRDNDLIINNGISLILNSLGKSNRLLIGNNDKIFTAYIADKISALLINDSNSNSYMLYPFENEDELVKWLHENNIFSWEDVRLEENSNG